MSHLLLYLTLFFNTVFHTMEPEKQTSNEQVEEFFSMLDMQPDAFMHTDEEQVIDDQDTTNPVDFLITRLLQLLNVVPQAKRKWHNYCKNKCQQLEKRNNCLTLRLRKHL